MLELGPGVGLCVDVEVGVGLGGGSGGFSEAAAGYIPFSSAKYSA